MNGNRVTLITLGVSNLEASCRFYQAIGFEREESPPSVAFYRCGTYYFGLFPAAELAKEQGKAPSDLQTGAMSLSQNYPDRHGVDTAHARALAAGATELAAPKETFWGGYSGYIADLDGHVWEYAHNPFWPLDADGHLA